MNNLGFSKDSVNIGDFRIKGQGETLRIGDDNGGDGYKLPTTRGTEGQVLTANADNTTSFQDAGGTGSARVVQNLLEMTEPYNSQYITNGSGRVMYEQATGSDIITTANLNVGDVVRFYACGYFWSNTGATLNSRFRLTIGVPNSDTSIDSYQQVGISGTGMNTSDPQRGGRFSWWIMCNVSKIDASDNCNITIHGQYAQPGFNDMLFTFDTTGVANGSRSNCRPKTESSLSGYYSTLPTTFQIRLDWLNDAGLPNDVRAIATTYRIDLMNTTEVLATTVSPTTDHNSLANLNVGDPHQLYAYLGGRSGGQVLSGGLTPVNFLTLKSHTAGANNIVVKDLNTSFEKNIDMNNNSIINNSLIQTDQIQTDLITTQSGGITLPIIADTRLLLTENNLPSGEYMEFTPTESKSYKNINMNNNNIDNVNQVSSSGTLTLIGALGNRCDIGVAGATRLEVENTRVFISQFADLNIHGQVIWVRPNTMPTLFNGDTTYIFVGSRNTSNSYVLPANVKIMGLGKNDSFINFNGGGTLFSAVDENLSVADITLTSSNNTGKLFDLTNAPQDKTINMTNLQIRNAKNGMEISGYDLVDLNNCIFTYFESGSPTPIGVRITNCSKLQLSSCEFLRWFQEGGTPATTFFNGNMLDLTGTLNALNLTGSFFHPQYDQNGIDTTFLSGVIEGTISSNTFIDINLNTGGGFQVLNLNPTIAPSYVVEGNSIYPNLRAQLTYVFSGVNASNTILSGGSNPNVVNTGGLAIPLASQFASLTAGGLATYLKKRSANFLITASANLQVIAGGAGQRVGLGLRVNGADIPNAYSFITLDSAGTEPKQTTLNFTGVASQNDTFELTIFNSSGNNDVLVSDVNFAGIEI